MAFDEKEMRGYIDRILNKEFVSIFLVDLNTDHLDFVYRNEGSGFKDVPDGVYTEIISEYITRVSKEFHEEWYPIANISALKELLKDKDQYELIYVLNGVDSRWRRCSMHVTKRDEEHYPIEMMMTYMTLDENRAHSLQLTQQLLEKETTLKRTKHHADRLNAVVSALSKSYEYIGYIEKDTNEIFRYYISQGFQQIIAESGVGNLKDKEIFTLLTRTIVANNDSDELMPGVNQAIDAIRSGKIRFYYAEFETTFHKHQHFFQVKMTEDYANRGNIIFGIMCIDAEKHRENELKKAMDDAEASNRAKTLFLNNMSHDIRTPMNAIIGFNGIAMRNVGMDDKKVTDALQKISKASDYLLDLINDILEVSRIESGTFSIQEENANIYSSFENIEPVMEELAADKSITLSFNVENIKDRYVICDKIHVNRIFVNIIGNAIKYTNRGGYVKVNCRQLNRQGDIGYYEYTFEDNGIGMSKEFLKTAFDRFSREDNNMVNKIQGTGIGLSLCKTMTNMLQGTISVESELGKGSKFTVILPFKIQKVENYHKEMSNIEVDLQEDDFIGKHILLVDDNEMNREIAIDLLEENGFTVTCANDGLQAYNRVKAMGGRYFDLILMDIQMPIMDGYESARKIREFLRGEPLPIIAVSANAFEEDRRKSLEAGMNEHLAKPIDMNKLKVALKQFMLKNKKK